MNDPWIWITCGFDCGSRQWAGWWRAKGEYWETCNRTTIKYFKINKNKIFKSNSY